MTDFLTPAERSHRMSRIRSSHTKPELALRRALHKRGLRYLLNDRRLPGKPDLVFPRFRTVVFVHGCFWHRHPGCKVASTPKSNTTFWEDKFQRNVGRDARAQASLSEAGWRVYLVWECELASARKVDDVADELSKRIRQPATPGPTGASQAKLALVDEIPPR